jgi:hypothetical protein
MMLRCLLRRSCAIIARAGTLFLPNAVGSKEAPVRAGGFKDSSCFILRDCSLRRSNTNPKRNSTQTAVQKY